MSQTKDLLTALKKCLRAKGLTYRDVASALQLSEASVKRLFSEHTFSLSRLEEVCRFLDMTIYDLARMTRPSFSDELVQLTVEQEQGLADDPVLLTYFYLMVTGRTPDMIAEEFGLDAQQQNTMLVRLSRLKLVELYPTNNGRLLTSNRIHWRQDGPVRKRYRKEVEAAFLQSMFAREYETFRFEMGELTDASAKIVERKIDRLIRELDEYVELDISAPRDSKKSYGLLVAFRPWTFWHILEGTANDMGLNAERSKA